jgi:uncharacterized sulfatase
MCSPTRHNIYTGLYPVKSGAYPNHTFVKNGTKSVVQYLRPLGYRVALSGKRHINPRSIFDFEYSGKKNNPNLQSIDQLFRQCATAATPFCLFACSNEPHGPWNKGDASRYPPDDLILPPHFVDTPATRQALSRYLAEVTYFDGQVGAILDLLDKHQLADNTLVIVTTEQGSGFPFAKWTCYDTGLQTALVARWPGNIQPATASDALIEYVDILPTFLEAAGREVPAAIEGRSLVPVFKGQSLEHKSHVFGIHTTRGINNGSDHFGIRSVRGRRYKYILNFSPEVTFTNACTQSNVFRTWRAAALTSATAADKVRRYQHRPAEELFDIQQDPYEWHNLATDPQYADIKKQLQRKLASWITSQGDRGKETELDAYTRQRRPRKREKK